MLILYGAMLAAGGILVLSSVLLGGHGDGGVDHDLGGHDVGDHDVSGHDASDHDGGHGTEHVPGTAWLPFLSLRFWTFGAFFFGLTGVLFTTLSLAGDGTTLATSIVLGLGCGTGAAAIVRALSSREVSSLSSELSCVGEQGEILLDVGPGVSGTVRVSIKGAFVDLPATADAGATIARGQKALVLDVQNGTARVGPVPAASA